MRGARRRATARFIRRFSFKVAVKVLRVISHCTVEPSGDTAPGFTRRAHFRVFAVVQGPGACETGCVRGGPDSSDGGGGGGGGGLRRDYLR